MDEACMDKSSLWYLCLPGKMFVFVIWPSIKSYQPLPSKKKSQEVAKIKGALHPMHWGVIGDGRKIVGIHNKYLTR